ncbi:MAG: hypothetical protein F6K29_33625, partial [Okeania sp. SIO2G5]|nr:hypothetical protein [Okeania sp. SIO2G5]
MVSSKAVSNVQSSKRGIGFGHSPASTNQNLTSSGEELSASDLNQQDPSQDAVAHPVVVTLLLAGGHEYQLLLAHDAPPLKQLFAVLMDPPEKRRSRLFQLPVQTDSGEAEEHSGPEAALCFTGDRLVGIVTDPPIYIQQPAHPPSETVPPQPTLVEEPIATAVTAVTAQPASSRSHYSVIASPERESSLGAGVIPSRYIQLTNFLDSTLHQQILDY